MNITTKFNKGYSWLELTIDNGDTKINTAVYENEIEDLFYQVNSLAQDLFDKIVELKNEHR